MSGTTVNNGQQQVSVYPYQKLSSVYGSSTLTGVVQPGVQNISATLSYSAPNITVTFNAGATMYFQRQATDPVFADAVHPDTVMIKVITTTPSTVTIPNSIWSGATQTIYIYADYTFDPVMSATTIYANLQYCTDAQVVALKAGDGTSNHVLFLCALLNNAGATANSSINYYHIAYDYTPQKNALNNVLNPNQKFNIFFDSNGRGIYVGSGNAMFGGKVFNYTANFYNALAYPTRGNLTGSGTGVVTSGTALLPLGLQYYTSDPVANTKVDVIGTATQSTYYQIDFLRYRRNDSIHAAELVWESFLKPKDPATTAWSSSVTYSINQFVTSGGLSYRSLQNGNLNNTPSPGGTAWWAPGYTTGTVGFLDGNLSANPMTLTNSLLRIYLQNFYFNLQGEGLNLLISVRQRSAIPTTDGSSNVMWPEQCLVLKDAHDFVIPSVLDTSRRKIPTYTSVDLGYI